MFKDHHWFHAGAWIGLVATGWTNWQAAPSTELQVGYLAVPVMLAVTSEGMIRNWRKVSAAVRAILAVIAFALVATSYEHFVHMILTAGGTDFAAWVGGAMLDLSVFVCVLMTCALRVPVSVPVPAIPEFVEIPVPVSGPIPELRVDVPELVEIPESAVPVSGPVPAVIPVSFAEPPATEVDGPTVPEFFREATADDFAPTSSAPVSPVSGGRAAKLAADMNLMFETFGDALPSTSEIMQKLECGGSRAARLQTAYAEHLEMLNGERR